MSISSLFKSVESIFTKTAAAEADVKAALVTADKFVGVLLGEAETVAGVLAAVDPTIGAPILAEVSALVVARAALEAAAPTIASNVSAVSTQVMQLVTSAMDLSVKLAPFFKVIANDASTAVAAVKAQAAAGAVA